MCCQCKFQITGLRSFLEETVVDYVLLYTFLLYKDECMYQEEGQITHRSIFMCGILVRDFSIDLEGKPCDRVIYLGEEKDIYPSISVKKEESIIRSPKIERGGYNPLAAVKYAERYWNEYNPNYPRFENDCTNFISQCLFAGGAKMYGESRIKGWWLRGNTWSYSWTTAHALYLFLKRAKTGLRGIEVSDPTELLLGDIICYDFEGDQRFNHTTIVVGKTSDGFPLVNAHTSNSRNRLWSYEDSTAYTQNIQYAFLQIYI